MIKKHVNTINIVFYFEKDLGVCRTRRKGCSLWTVAKPQQETNLKFEKKKKLLHQMGLVWHMTSWWTEAESGCGGEGCAFCVFLHCLVQQGPQISVLTKCFSRMQSHINKCNTTLKMFQDLPMALEQICVFKASVITELIVHSLFPYTWPVTL